MGVATAAMIAGFSGQAQAADRLDLAVVKPVVPCNALTSQHFTGVTDAPTTVTSAQIEQTDKGAYCRVEGTIAPGIGFTVELPVEHWTQRLLENAMGRQTPGQAGGCAPALDGEFVVASDRSTSGGGQQAASWISDMQQRINYAYRGNHQSALVAKVLIRNYYG